RCDQALRRPPRGDAAVGEELDQAHGQAPAPGRPTAWPASRRAEIAASRRSAGTRIQSVSKVEIAKIGTPASASGTAIDARTPVSVCSRGPAPTKAAPPGAERSPAGTAAASQTTDVSAPVLATATIPAAPGRAPSRARDPAPTRTR